MLAATKKTLEGIKSLKIQGAESVALAAVSTFARELESARASGKKEFMRNAISLSSSFSQARPTEPALRNALRFIVFKARKSSLEKPKELAELVSKTAAEYKRHSLENKEKIAEYGSNLVRDGGSVLVHCHSGTVMRVLKRARDKKKDFRVFCCETRPLYQGRISARELSDYGIETTLIVDSAASSTMKKMSDEDIVLVGCDAITAQGDLVNKIGTFQIALAASALDKNLYSCTGLHKFEPLTLSGIPEPIEERSLEEVLPEKERKKWGKKSRKFANVINPAFDLTPSNLIKAFVTEYGVVPPASLVAFAEKEGLLEY